MNLKKTCISRNGFNRLIIIILLCSLLFSIVPVNAVGLEIEGILPSDNAENEQIMPLAMGFSPAWYATTSAATLTYAPHPSVSAVTSYYLPAGTGVWLLGRTYDCFYVHYDVPGGKVMRGYIPISALNPTSYLWIDYDVYRPAVCTATTQVLSGPGTTNTYYAIGEVYANEAPLMVLGTEINQYNNVTYYYIEYMTTDSKVKRGWIDPREGTITYMTVNSTNLVDYSESQFSFVNSATGKAMTWDKSTNYVVQQPFTGSLEQTFFLEKSYNNNIDSGYYKIVPAADPTLAVTIQSTGYADSLPMMISTKGTPNKRQEFKVKIHSFNSGIFLSIHTRCSGEYRALAVYDEGSSVNNLIQTAYIEHSKQLWTPYRIDKTFDGTYGQYGGNSKPFDFNVHYDSSSFDDYQNHASFAYIEDAVERWNAVYGDLSLNTILLGNQPQTNRLAPVKSVTFATSDSDVVVVGRCRPQSYSSAGLSFMESENSMNENWHSTVVGLYMSYMVSNGYSASGVNLVLTHELGHSLKLSHTYCSLVRLNGSITWDTDETVITTSIMNPRGNPLSITSLDVWRLKRKWQLLT